MTNEDKQLLLRDLCARLSYGVICQLSSGDTSITEKLGIGGLSDFMNGSMKIKPYLRPMSSMTEEKKKEFNKTKDKIVVQWDNYGMPIGYEYTYTIKTFDWLNAHHFDYRGLIKRGLAFDAPEGMYE